jgi:glycerate kinase
LTLGEGTHVRVVIAPDKFKGCLTAARVSDAIAAGWRRADAGATLDICPMADGGEGTVAALVAARGGRVVRRRVTGPLAEMKVQAEFGLLGDGKTAVVEMAAASGMALLKPGDRDPMMTTTFGTGELVCAAAEMGAERVIVGLGGSATIDCGIGMAQACGLPVLMEGGEPVADGEPLRGGDLERVVFVKHGRGGKVDRVRFEAACDVSNPLFGPTGAAETFGRQKGATEEQVRWFDGQLQRIAQRTGNDAAAQLPGAGAAGGLGFALAAFFGATLRPGIEMVMEAARLEERLKGADLCITGEGSLDGQSAGGKTAAGVGRLCKRLGVPCVAIVGSIGEGAERVIGEGINAYFSICDRPMGMEEAMGRAEELIAQVATNLARVVG